MMRRLVVVFMAALGLAACSSWMGESQAPPLPGKRISVLSREKTLEPEITGEAAVIKLPPPEANEDWPQAGGYANHAMHHMEVGDRLERQWRTGVGEGSGKRVRLLAPPIVAEGLAFTVDTESLVRAVDANTGRVRWSKNVTPEDDDDYYPGGGVAYEDGQLFVSTGFAQMVSLDAKTGKVLWRQNLSGPMRGAPTVRAGRVFVITVDNQTHALATEDGAVLWSHQGISEGASLLGGTSPAVDGEVVVVAYSSGEMFALRVENGIVLWQEQLTTVRRTDNVATLSDIRGRPIIDRGRVYAIGHADMLVAVDLRSGRRLWEREIGGIQSPWVAGDYLFLVSNDNKAVALEARTGRILWVTQLRVWEDEEDHEGRVVWAGPVLASDRLILANSLGELVSMSPYSGEVLGKIDAPDGVSLPPAVAGGALYFLTEDADLVAYR
jgi:FOG: WD40-like repeat